MQERIGGLCLVDLQGVFPGEGLFGLEDEVGRHRASRRVRVHSLAANELDRRRLRDVLFLEKQIEID